MRLRFLVAAAAMLSASLAARADTIYGFTGDYYTFANGAYIISDSVTGTFTLANDLATTLGRPNTTETITSLSFSFSDGLQTITSSNATSSQFAFSVDSNGKIQSYAVNVHTGINNFIVINTGPQIQVADGSSNAGGRGGAFALVTPEPSSIALFGTGMLGVVGVVRKRFA